MSTRRSKRAKLKLVASHASATQAERDGLKFAPIYLEFKWTNEDWALAHLPTVRAVTMMLREDSDGLQERFGKLAAQGAAPQILEGLTLTKDHLMALAEACDIALTRSFLVLERLGYSPDNPPPGDGSNHSKIGPPVHAGGPLHDPIFLGRLAPWWCVRRTLFSEVSNKGRKQCQLQKS
ncbi:hypothetical protein [Bradyrhizobium lablabi]|uniref:hypothetical protein n=1 Tax=Bradyrhizobium lablabi TaxID=722472 RepID=UPI001BA66271|nr:hypothetical protein [Bradyrhizobium lablabi]MBR0693245.1 hypothetical protein [Bradyrhizobium lablabi]